MRKLDGVNLAIMIRVKVCEGFPVLRELGLVQLHRASRLLDCWRRHRSTAINAEFQPWVSEPAVTLVSYVSQPANNCLMR